MGVSFINFVLLQGIMARSRRRLQFLSDMRAANNFNVDALGTLLNYLDKMGEIQVIFSSGINI